jgi:metal-responsive CopG/Arc/MetJ family transcriptional regulator
MSARRSKTKYTQIHVSIPVRLLEDFDDTLQFNQSRSKLISTLIKNHLDGDGSELYAHEPVELIEFLQYKFTRGSPEDVLIESLLKILSK